MLCGFQARSGGIGKRNRAVEEHALGHAAAVLARYDGTMAAMEVACSEQGVPSDAWQNVSWPTEYPRYLELIETFFRFRPGTPEARRFWIANGGALGPGQRRRLK